MTDYFQAVAQGLGNVLSFPNILIPVLGTMIAMIGSFLPGIGGASLSAIVLVATLHWDPISVLLIFGALTGSATFMGSITAILFGVPGNASSSALLLDGHPMARKGQARTAIACAATASALGSVFGVLVLLLLLPMVQPLLLEFGPLERVLLGIWGLSAIIAIPNASPLRAIAAALVGLVVAMIGSDPLTAQARWTFGSFQLFEGFGTVALLLGFFTLSEVIGWRKNYRIASEDPELKTGSTIEGVRAVLRHPGLTARSSVIGTLVGIIPGVGGTVASFISYGQAARTPDRPENFGKGDIRGVIAPEAAVDSKDGGSLLPVFAFGLPGSEGGVILVTVLAIHGLVPGTPMLTEHLSLSMTLVFALLFSNILTSFIGVSLSPVLSQLTRLRIDRLALPALLITFVTIVQLHGLLADLYVAVAFGLLGYLFKRLDWPRVPFIIAFVLGVFIERNLTLVAPLARVGRLSFWEQPAAMIIAGMITFSVIWMLIGRRRALKVETVQRGDADIAFAGFLCSVCLVLAISAIFISGHYSAYALTVTWAAALLCGFICLTGLLARGADTDGVLAAIPPDSRISVGLLAMTPFMAWACGLPMAMALLTFFWLRNGTEIDARKQFFSILYAVIAFAISYGFIYHFARLRLPDPALLSLLGLT